MSGDSVHRDRSLVLAALAWTVAVNVGAFAASPIAEALFILVIFPALAAAIVWVGLLLRAASVTGRRMIGKQPLGWAPHVLAGLLLVAAIGYAGEWRWLANQGDALDARRRLESEREGYDEIVSDLRAGRIEIPGRLGATERIRGVTYSVLSTSPLRVAFMEPVGYVLDPTEWMVYDPSGAVQHEGAVPAATKYAGDFVGCLPITREYFRCWSN